MKLKDSEKETFREPMSGGRLLRIFDRTTEVITRMADGIDQIAEIIADEQFAESFREQVTLKECIAFAKECRLQHPMVAGFIIVVQANLDPRNENDKLIIVQGMLNNNRKPISADGGSNALSRTLHTKTIDEEFVKFLDGNDKRICMF